MVDIARLVIEVETSQIKAAQAAIAALGGSAVAASGNANKVTSSFSAMSVAGIGATAALYGLSRAAQAVFSAAAEAEKMELRLAAVIKGTGYAAGLTLKQMNDFASGLQSSLKINDEKIKESMAVLVTFKNVSGTMFKDAIIAAANMSAIFGGDLTSSTMQLGKALENPVQGVTALTRSGISFSPVQKDMIKNLVETNKLLDAQSLIMQTVTGQIGDPAAAQAGGLSGSVAGLANSWDEFLESIGRTESVVRPVMAVFSILESSLSGLSTLLTQEVSVEIVKLNKQLIETENRIATLKADGVGEAWLRPENRLKEELKNEIDLLIKKARVDAEAEAAELSKAAAGVAAQKAKSEAENIAAKASEAQKKYEIESIKRAKEILTERENFYQQTASNTQAQIQYAEQLDAADDAAAKTLNDRIQALRDETFLVTATLEQTRELTIQRDLETAGLEKGTAAWKEYEARLRSALDGQRLAKDNADAIKKMDAQWDKFTDDIKRSMTDSIVRAFENGESAGKVFFDSLRRAAMTALIKIPVDFAVDSASGFLRSAIGGAAGASAGGSLAGSFGASGGGGMLGGIGAGVAGLSLLQGTGAAGQAMMGNAFMSTSRFFGAGAGTQGAFGNAGANFANPTNVLGSFAANMALNQILGNRGIGADIGSTIGGVAGSFLPIPGGTIIGAATGNIIGGMFGGGTQNSNAGGRISEVNGQFSAAGIQGDRPSGTMIADITNVLTTVASVLNEFTATLGTLQTGNTDYASFIDTLGSRGITDASGIIREVITSNLIEGITEAEKAIIAGTSDALAGLREVAAVRLQTTTSNVFRDDLAALRKSLEDPKQSQIDLLNIERDGMIARARALTDGTQALADIEAIYQFKLTDINKQFATSVVTVISDVIEIAGLRLDAANDNLSRASSIVTKAVEAERAGVTGRYNLALKISQTALDGLTKSAQRLASIAALLKGAIPDIPGQEGASRIAGQVTLSAALAAARAGGALPDEETLRRALDAVAKPSEGLFSNFVDYQRDFITTANDIANLSDIAEWQRMSADLSVTTAQTALEQDRAAYDAELVRLDGILSSAQDQIDAVNGTTIAVMSIQDAIQELALALTGARAAGGAVAAANPVNSLFRGLLGRNADQSGAAHFDAALAGGQSTIDVAQDIIRSQEFANSHRTVESLYSIFGSGRAPDAEGMAYWSAQLASGAQSLEEIALNFTRGQEYADLMKVRGFAYGGSHTGGMRIVGERGPELEFTGPSQIFSNGKSEAMLDNSAVVSELKQMRTELNAVLISIAAKTVDTDARYRKWDTVGLPPTRVT